MASNILKIPTAMDTEEPQPEATGFAPPSEDDFPNSAKAAANSDDPWGAFEDELTESVPRPDLRDIRPNPMDYSLVPIARVCPKDVTKAFIDSFHNLKTFKDTINNVARYLQGTRDWEYDVEKVYKMLPLTNSELQNSAVDFLMTVIYITPFNFFSELIGCGQAKCKGIGQYEPQLGNVKKALIFEIRGAEHPVDIETIALAYTTSLPIFAAANAMSRTVLYRPSTFNFTAMQMSLFLSSFATLTFSSTGTTIAFRGVSNPGMRLNALPQKLETTLGRVAQQLINAMDWSHAYAKENDVLGVFYCNINDNWSVVAKTRAYSIYHDMVVMYYKTPDTPKFLFTPTDTVVGPMVDQLLRNADIWYADSKERLEGSRGWRSGYPNADHFTHGLAFSDRSIQLSDKQWGHYSRLTALSAGHHRLHMVPKSIYIHGSGSDKLAVCVTIDQEVGFLNFEASTVSITVSGPGNPSPPPGVLIVHPGLTPFPPGSINYFIESTLAAEKFREFVPMQLSRVIKYGTVIDNPAYGTPPSPDASGTLTPHPPKITVDLPTVVMVNHNYCDLDEFEEIFNYGASRNFRVTLHRHPRLHNDHYTWIFTSDSTGSVPSDWTDAIRFRAIMSLQLTNNNDWRNNVIMTGFLPPMTSSDPKFLQGCALIIRRVQLKKNVGKAARKMKSVHEARMRAKAKAAQDYENWKQKCEEASANGTEPPGPYSPPDPDNNNDGSGFGEFQSGVDPMTDTNPPTKSGLSDPSAKRPHL